VKTNDIVGFVNSDYASDLDKIRFISGNIFTSCGLTIRACLSCGLTIRACLV
jgi:hypothetical protein